MESAADPIDTTGTSPDAGPGWRVEPSGWTDQLTGTDGPRLWDRILSSETARVKRYHGLATIVLAELTGIDDFSAVWGAEAAGRLFVQLARALAVEVRSSDHIARLGVSRFGILLIETDEIAAINFVERARAACDKQIRTPDLVTVAFGWAGPTGSSDLRAAVDVAADRLAAEMADAA
ncbi:MAG TPA: diguanylate cyclase [Candidatus Limnocylindrales bacterium]|nr:diguanylate cyclase [Candidatus Limnocylindrales bacterium]